MRDYYSEYLAKCGIVSVDEVSKVSKASDVGASGGFDTFDTSVSVTQAELLAGSSASFPVAGTAMGKAYVICSCGMCAYVGQSCPRCHTFILSEPNVH